MCVLSTEHKEFGCAKFYLEEHIMSFIFISKSFIAEE